MEAPLHIVGCVLSSKPAAELVDAFVTQVRRERAAVMSRSPQAATFVRFNAPDARLVTLACRALREPGRALLRFGFTASTAEATNTAADGHGISTHSIVQASDLAAGAREGEVLVSPQLALLLIEAGFTLRSRQIHLPGGRVIAACALEQVPPGEADEGPDSRPDSGPDTQRDFEPSGGGDTVLQDLMPDRPAARARSAGQRSVAAPAAPSALPHKGDAQKGDSLGAVFLALTAQAEQMVLRQLELESRQDTMLGKMTRVEESSSLPARRLGELEAALEAQVQRVSGRLEFIDTLEQRVNQLQGVIAALERKLAQQLRRREEVETLQSLCDTMVAQMVDAQVKLDGMAAAQAQLPPMASQVAALAQILESSQRTFATFAGRLGELDRSAESVEQKMQSLAEQEARARTLEAELAELRQMSERGRADVQFVQEHRADIATLRAQVEDLMGRIADTGGKMDTIEARRQMVEEVQSRAVGITHMLGDMQLKVEMLEEQRAAIDHAGEKLARLDYTVQEAQNTLRALQHERELAERVEQGIKALRAQQRRQAADLS